MGLETNAETNTTTLTTNIKGIELNATLLNNLVVDELKILADVYEMNYVYTNKPNLIKDIMTAYNK